MIDPLLHIVADNPALSESLQRHIITEFEFDVTLDVGKNNEELGEVVRARLEGVRKIKEAFKKISQLKKTPDQPPKVNGAR